jgi:hypothetical protein
MMTQRKRFHVEHQRAFPLHYLNTKTDYNIQIQEEENYGKAPEQLTLNCNRPYGLIPKRIMMLSDNNFP